jgi:hypothetical protein
MKEAESNNDDEVKYVPPPDRVTVRVDELLKLREEAAMLAALKQAKVEQWHGYSLAEWLYNSDSEIKDIKAGWKSVLGHRTDRGT